MSVHVKSLSSFQVLTAASSRFDDVVRANDKNSLNHRLLENVLDIRQLIGFRAELTLATPDDRKIGTYAMQCDRYSSTCLDPWRQKAGRNGIRALVIRWVLFVFWLLLLDSLWTMPGLGQQEAATGSSTEEGIAWSSCWSSASIVSPDSLDSTVSPRSSEGAAHRFDSSLRRPRKTCCQRPA